MLYLLKGKYIRDKGKLENLEANNRIHSHILLH